MKLQKWEEKVIYQIFPRSFRDANNDGNGDIAGITSKLKYLKQLGIDIIWLCPTYDTEFADAGYDVLDYKKVWKTFGTLEDFQELIKEAKKLDIDIMLDIVLNHTSNKHPWFIKAIESKENPEYNMYIWKDEPDASESIFGGSAWEFEPSLGEYYFHLFAKEQVDLNWDHPATITAMADVIDFWYSLGVKYFRLDAIQHVHKEVVNGKLNFSFGSKMVEQLQNFLNKVKQDKDDVVFVGEASGIDKQKALRYGKGKEKIADSFYNFSWWWIGWGKQTGRNGYDANWQVQDFLNQGYIDFQNDDNVDPGLIVNFLTNHDTSRAISRWGDENLFWQESAKSLAMMQFLSKGNQCIYYGEEIGMLNANFASRKEFRDVDALNAFANFVDEQNLYTEAEMTRYHAINGRDNSRYPMQWHNGTNFGFNLNKEPWIKLGRHPHRISVAEQENDPSSIFNFYKTLVQLRKRSKYAKTIVYGNSRVKYLGNNLIEIVREDVTHKLRALINVSSREINDIAKFDYKQIILSSYSDNKEFKNQLRPYESILFEMKKGA